MGRLGVRRYEGWLDSKQYDAGEPSQINLPDGPPDHRRRMHRERDVADVAAPARVHRPASPALRQALERC